jgi:hypothetical protein
VKSPQKHRIFRDSKNKTDARILPNPGRPGSPPPELLNVNVGQRDLFLNSPRVPQNSTKVLTASL